MLKRHKFTDYKDYQTDASDKSFDNRENKRMKTILPLTVIISILLITFDRQVL